PAPAPAGPEESTTAPADTSATTAPADTTGTTAAAGGGLGGALPLPAQESTTTAPPVTSATTAPADSTPTTAAPTTPTTILATTPPDKDVADQQVVLPERDSTGKVVRRYVLGPAFLTGSAVSGADAVFQNGWQVNLDMKGGANGIDTWNKVTGQCFSGASICPGIGSRGRGLVAITLDGTVKSAREI